MRYLAEAPPSVILMGMPIAAASHCEKLKHCYLQTHGSEKRLAQQHHIRVYHQFISRQTKLKTKPLILLNTKVFFLRKQRKKTSSSLLHHCIIMCYFIRIIDSDIHFQHSSTILHNVKKSDISFLNQVKKKGQGENLAEPELITVVPE